jgi:prepilin-type N-terminal cleavage/methylation domain-containing protein
MNTPPESPGPRSAAFTLMEIMVVVGIIGLIMAMGAPTLYHMLHREGFNQTVSDVVEVCSSARAQAILQGRIAEVIFHPLDRRCEVGGGVSSGMLASGAPGRAATAVHFSDEVSIEMLDVNLLEYKDAAVARVRFFPNGTSDELTLILRSDRNDWRKIALETTTGLATVDSDPHHWK